MFEKIAGIQIKGEYFNDVCKFAPLAINDGQPISMAVIYGKNGSGKTSLAKGFYEFASGKKTFSQIDIINHEGTIIPPNEINKEAIYVFDENYITEKIRFVEEGLDSVVMLGEQVDLDEQIRELEKQKDGLSKQLEKDASDYKKAYEASDSLYSPEYHRNAIRDSLKNGWADREKDFRKEGPNRLTQKASVREPFIDELLQSKDNIDLVEARKLFDSKLAEFTAAQTSDKVLESLPKIVENAHIDDDIISLLSEQISEPSLSENEKLIMQIIQNNSGNEELFKKAKEVFSDDSTDRCPFCLQKIEPDDKQKLVDSITKVFDTDEANLHREELLTIKQAHFSIDLGLHKNVDAMLCDNIQKAVTEYNNIVDLVNEAISKKQSSIYFPIIVDGFGLSIRQPTINNMITELEELSISFNIKIDDISDLAKQLPVLNKNLAIAEAQRHIELYNKQLFEQEAKKSELSSIAKELEQTKMQIAALNAKKKSIDIAVDIINEYLSYIFFEKDRLQLYVSDGKYTVKCRGKNIRLKSLSIGERNVIALCYFLSGLFNDKSKENLFKDECLLVLDDPISSFDFENKVGIYSFLRLIFSSINAGNAQSRCIVLTHEIEAIFNLIKVCKDIDVPYKSWELKDKGLHIFKEKHNEYSNMLWQIYTYAGEESGCKDLDETIGNIMRRVLEAFGTFSYKNGIEGLSCDEEVLESIPDIAKRRYFNNLMYRLVLNGESHLKERVQGIPETDFFTFIDAKEKRRTAKEILIFISLLNHLHLKKHLKRSPKDDISAALAKISSWENELFGISNQ